MSRLWGSVDDRPSTGRCYEQRRALGAGRAEAAEAQRRRGVMTLGSAGRRLIVRAAVRERLLSGAGGSPGAGSAQPSPTFLAGRLRSPGLILRVTPFCRGCPQIVARAAEVL